MSFLRRLRRAQCNFCAACGVQTTPSTRYVVFICPFLSCFILSTENLHHILATIAVAARHFLHRAERHFRDTRSVQNDDLDEVRDLQLPFFSRVLNQRTTYYIRCLCYVIGAASRFLRRLRRAVTTQNAICCMLAAIDLAAGHSGGSRRRSRRSSSRRSRRRQQTEAAAISAVDEGSGGSRRRRRRSGRAVAEGDGGGDGGTSIILHSRRPHPRPPLVRALIGAEAAAGGGSHFPWRLQRAVITKHPDA